MENLQITEVSCDTHRGPFERFLNRFGLVSIEGMREIGFKPAGAILPIRSRKSLEDSLAEGRRLVQLANEIKDTPAPGSVQDS